MAKPITAFVPYCGSDFTRRIVDQLLASGLVGKIYLLATGDVKTDVDGARVLRVDSLFGSDTIRSIAKKSTTPYTLFITHDTAIEFGQFGVGRLVSVAEMSGSGLVFSDYFDIKDGKRTPHPV
ncbi:MAG: putative glycosyltransferase, partial [Bacteroidetes bacterium]|nr:putative glycosyltransferase [Bacteroidota bacterium]